ncbi:unnamed protein product [Dracunculus medinensis]|uniref:FLYWCH-type domain-containing protein n=1 Tax=Dracunculus medinensis TaxID=318479 RepID=A0A0N4UIT8_DRAME|nr:unnamed protein product [Dracunculus medinensis]
MRFWKLFSPNSVKCAKECWSNGIGMQEPVQEVDVERIISRRERRYDDKRFNESDEYLNPKPIEHISNEIATVLAIDQLLDNSFLISDQELEYFVPSNNQNLKIISANRDHWKTTTGEYCPLGWRVKRSSEDGSPLLCDPINRSKKCPKPYLCISSQCKLNFCCASQKILDKLTIENEFLEEDSDAEL